MTKINEEYNRLHADFLVSIASALALRLRESLEGAIRIDSISARAKSPERFVEKAAKRGSDGQLKYPDPFAAIQDFIGARVVVYYLRDVNYIKNKLLEEYREIERIDKEPDDLSKFAYFGWHAICFLPNEVVPPGYDGPKIFELQVKTLFQHAWSEASHDISYKQKSGQTDRLSERLIYFAAAQAWGCDNSFETVLKHLDESSE